MTRDSVAAIELKQRTGRRRDREDVENLRRLKEERDE
jgi:hypothetical protein